MDELSRMANNRRLFAEKLSNEFVGKVTGEDISRLVHMEPGETFLVGKISPYNEESNVSSKVNIQNIGVDFFIHKNDIQNARLIIQPRGDFYYQVLPKYNEQFEEVTRTLNVGLSRKINCYEELSAYLERNPESVASLGCTKLALAYEKISIDNFKPLEVKVSDVFKSTSEFAKISLKGNINLQLDSAIDEILKRPDICRSIRDYPDLEDMQNEKNYSDYLLRNSGKDLQRPSWSLEVMIYVRLVKADLYRVSVELINDTSVQINSKRKPQFFSNILFNSGIDIKLENAIYQNIEMKYFDSNYKYDRYQKAIGSHCSVEYDNKSNIISTQSAPVFKQYRFKTKDKVIITFKDLINDPINKLLEVYQKMLEEKCEWERYLADELPKQFRDKTILDKAVETFKNEIEVFNMEIKRFKYGMDQIKLYDSVRQSFIAMNESFQMNKKYDSWRLFQIVFIVSLIPDIIVSEFGEEEIKMSQIEYADLLYFPTGGGKTEAFLGITIFTLFFDRYRGKKIGVSTIIKYPLRLLSVQQVDRLVNALAWAEEIRQSKIDLFSGDFFSVGYYVGDKSTPNKFDDEKLRELKSLSPSDINEKYRIIEKCPFCGQQSIVVRFDESDWRLKHTCTNKNCSPGQCLPIYVVDHEIYRYLPSVIVSTIDKIASIGLNSNFRNILGDVNLKCPLHGYFSKSKCLESRNCSVTPNKYINVDLKDAAPTLFIQDEIHLIRESLGTFDSHYETFIQYYLKKLGKYKKKIKIIGATATISNYKDQIKQLYDKNAIRFPAESPFIGKDFYSFTDANDLHRIIIGFAPYGKAIMNSIVYAMKYMREIVWKYFKDIDLIKTINGIDIQDNKEVIDIIQDYWVFIEYNNIKRDATDIQTAIDNIINAELINDNITPFKFRSMTGDDSFQEVRKVLFDLDTDKNIQSSVNLINATNMISHGVDASRFNTIFFYGMPRNTAEYIQAYSRVGRTHTGIVIDIIRPSRDKDMSYLKNFVKFHDYKDILIDPVPINRWANNAIKYTYPGILSGLFINFFDKHLNTNYSDIYDVRNLKRAIEDGAIKKEEAIEHLKKAYQCIYDDLLPVDLGVKYSEYISFYTEKFFNDISSAIFDPNNNYITNNINKIVPELERVMNSLRDPEETVTIEMR